MPQDPVPRGGAARILTPGQIATYALGAGFSGSDAITAVAIALAESGGNVNAHNNRPPDDSYGLWQINMLGSLGPNRRKQFGISSNEALYDPATNAKAAKMVKDGQGWTAWSVYKSGKYVVYAAKARSGVDKPEPDGGNSSPPPPVNQGETENVVDVLAPLRDFTAWLIEQLKPFTLRVAGFIGGGVLLIIGIVIYVRGQM